MSTITAGKLRDILAVGANVTIPTTAWGTWTGEIIAIRETGPLAPEGEVFVTIRDADGSDQEVRTSRNYTGYLNAPAVTAETEAAPVQDTVSTRKVWRCAGNSGSMFAKRDMSGFVEIFQSDLEREREAGTHLFRITL
jgi:hypothetical protein